MGFFDIREGGNYTYSDIWPGCFGGSMPRRQKK